MGKRVSARRRWGPRRRIQRTRRWPGEGEVLDTAGMLLWEPNLHIVVLLSQYHVHRRIYSLKFPEIFSYKFPVRAAVKWVFGAVVELLIPLTNGPVVCFVQGEIF